jgi:Predicted membrane protein
MDTLVICIDRDNDLGEKAKVITPVVGRGANIAAAVSLATMDPEDSDTNTIFGGIRILDELRSLGVDADIVSFAGDKNVGTISDRRIAEQLDEFLSKQEVKSAIFVSDGAEDESLIPIVQSRVKIDSVRRIIVMQSENLESTYYMIKNFLKDPKFLQTFFVPIGLALIIYAIAMARKMPDLAIVGTFFVVGVYMLLRAYSLNEKIVLAWRDLKQSFYTQKLSFITTIVALLFFIIGTADGSIGVWENINVFDGLIPIASLFVKRASLWYAASIFIALLGKIFDKMRTKEDYQNLIVEMLFALSGTLIFWSAGSYILSIAVPGNIYEFSINYFIFSIVLSILIALIGIYFAANPTKDKDDEKENNKMESNIYSPKTAKHETFISVTEGTEDVGNKNDADMVKISIENDE